MLPGEWAEMGGSICDDCSTCVMTEWYVAQSLAGSCSTETSNVPGPMLMPMGNLNPTRSLLSTGAYISAMGEILPTSFRSTWFTQDDINTLIEDGINTVRIPVSAIASSTGRCG